MYYRKFVRNILCSVSALCFIVIATVIVVDPLQVFHKSWFHPGKYCSDFSVGSLAVIKYVDFDSVILGSCLLQNTSAKEVSEKLNGNFINVSFIGGTYYERSIILRKVFFEKKKVKHIIFTVDPYYVLTRSAFSGMTLMNCEFLYKNNCSSIENIGVYLKYPRLFWKWALGKDFVSDFDKPLSWGGDAFGGFHNWIELLPKQGLQSYLSEIKNFYLNNPKSISITDQNRQLIEEILQESIIPLVKANTNTVFHLVIPPYSKLHWKTDVYGRFEAFKHMLKYLVKQLSNNKNSYIYGFDNEDFTSNIAKNPYS